MTDDELRNLARADRRAALNAIDSGGDLEIVRTRIATGDGGTEVLDHGAGPRPRSMLWYGAAVAAVVGMLLAGIVTFSQDDSAVLRTVTPEKIPTTVPSPTVPLSTVVNQTVPETTVPETVAPDTTTVEVVVPQSTPVAIWSGRVERDISGSAWTLAASGLNDFIATAGPAWAADPLAFGHEIAPPGDEDGRVEVAWDGADGALTITSSNLADDSAFASRWTILLQLNSDGLYRFVSGTSTQQCQPGRGHQDFRPEPCL